MESESDLFITLFLRWVCLCDLCFVCDKFFSLVHGLCVPESHCS